MELKLFRKYKLDGYTIGKLYIDGIYFCDTLEDKDRNLTKNTNMSEINKIKVKGATAIPTGTYKVTMNVVSTKYSNTSKYPYVKSYGSKMPRLLDVPGFAGILIHTGNSANDTDGCILVGENKVVGQVINSQATWKKLMDKLLEDKDNITIEIC